MTLAVGKPACITLTPDFTAQRIKVDWTITGVNEDQVMFAARQGASELAQTEYQSSNQETIKSKNKSDIELCWASMDKKAKRVSFVFQKVGKTSDAKA